MRQINVIMEHFSNKYKLNEDDGKIVYNLVWLHTSLDMKPNNNTTSNDPLEELRLDLRNDNTETVVCAVR